MNSLHVLNHSGLQIQFVLVAGGDDRLYNEFKTTEWHTATHIHNYVEQIPSFMHASNLVMGKAGGLSVTEALACGLPSLIVDVTPGQEEGNVNYIIKHKAGELSKNAIQTLEILFHWLQRDQQLLTEMAANAAELGKPKSAFSVADLAWEAAEKGRSVPSSRILSWVPKFRELLRTFDISETAEN
jgi:UDP-N-acetylglucosamine:LPS N-acetylglucosamine transferase